MASDTIVYLCDRDLRPVTDPIPWTAVDATVRHLEPGTGIVTCAATDPVMAGLATGEGRIGVIVHDGAVWMAGPVERPYAAYRWSAGPGDDVEPGRVTFALADYLALLAPKITYPDPASPWSDQSAAGYYTGTGTASTVLLALVDANAGPSAHTTPDRRVPHLVMGSDPLLGATVTLSTRFKWLLDEARSIVAQAAGVIGYRTVFDQATRQVTFQVYATTDRSKNVRFSRALRNLREVAFEVEIPRANAELVAGQGEGTARVTVERIDTASVAAYWRMEEFRDRRDAADTGALEAGGDERLLEQAETVKLSAVTVDTTDQRYGAHYGLGDTVTLEPVPGLVLTDTVRAVRLQVTPKDGAVVTAQIGAQAQTSDPEWLRQSRDLARRLSTLEAI